jgi:hypothetical protein
MRNPFAKERPAPEPTVQEARAARLVEIAQQLARARAEYEALEERSSSVKFKVFQSSRGVPVGLTQEEHVLTVAMDELRIRLSKLMSEYAILSSNANETVHREGKLIRHA